MNEIFILALKVLFLLFILIGSGFAGKYIALKNDKSVSLFFIVGLLTGPIGLLFIFIIIV